jgi:hypothetical protein
MKYPLLFYLPGWRLPEDRSVLEPVRPPTGSQKTPKMCLNIVIFHLRDSLALGWFRPKLGGSFDVNRIRDGQPSSRGVSPDAAGRNRRRRPETRLT